MCTLHGLFELHLVAEQNKIIRTSRHRDSVGKRHLSSFVDKEEMQFILPLGTTEEPRGSADNAARILRVTGASVFNMVHSRIGFVKSVIRFIADLYACEFSAIPPGCL